MKVGTFMATLSLTSREYPQHILDETRYLGANPPGLGGEAFLQNPMLHLAFARGAA
jgi:hypothetical protein